jgi:hypothetical protein
MKRSASLTTSLFVSEMEMLMLGESEGVVVFCADTVSEDVKTQEVVSVSLPTGRTFENDMDVTVLVGMSFTEAL